MPDISAASPALAETAEYTWSGGARRHVLLLQGLMGPLFRWLGRGLMRDGHSVHKVNFNGGDRAFWRLPNGIDYRGSLEEWPGALRRLIGDKGITDVVLFGDCRPHHLIARQVCQEMGIPVHVFEEGYIRPDWVTLELGGVNGHSSLPRDPVWYRETAAALPPVPPHAQVPSSFRRRATEGLIYNVADVFTRWRYPHWNNHRPWPPLVEGMGWLRKLRQGKEKRARGAELIARLETSDQPYFIFPLQLDSDAQIRLHSPFPALPRRSSWCWALLRPMRPPMRGWWSRSIRSTTECATGGRKPPRLPRCSALPKGSITWTGATLSLSPGGRRAW